MKTILKTSIFVVFVLGLAISEPSKAEGVDPLMELGVQFSESIRTRDFTIIEARFDKFRFSDRVVSIMKLSKADGASLKPKLVSSISIKNIITKAFSGIDSTTIKVKMLGVMDIEGQKRPVIRVSFPGGGTNYFELIVNNAKGQYYIEDMFVATNSQNMSDTMGQAMAMILDQPSGWIASLIDEGATQQGINKILLKSFEYRKSGDFKSMYETLQKLPDEIIKNDNIHLMLVVASQNIDENTYRKELSIFAKNHGKNPRFAFMLIDHYFYTKQYDLALECIEEMQNRYKGDASLLVLKASILLSNRQYKKVVASLQEALNIEPDYEDIYWTGVTSTLNAKDFSATIKWLEKYESQFDYFFSRENFSDQDIYNEFVASDEFNSWMKSKQVE